MARTFNTTVLAQAFVKAGVMGNVLQSPSLSAVQYQWDAEGGMEDNARLLVGLQDTAYWAVVFAHARELNNETPVTDVAEEGDEEEMQYLSGYIPEVDGKIDHEIKRQTYAEAQNAASAFHRYSQSVSKIPGLEWLHVMYKGENVKGEDGVWRKQRTQTYLMVPFGTWLDMKLEAYGSDTEGDDFFMALYNAKNLNKTTVPLWNGGFNEAKDTFIQWVNDVPWTREQLPFTRLEKAVMKYAHKAFEDFVHMARYIAQKSTIWAKGTANGRYGMAIRSRFELDVDAEADEGDEFTPYNGFMPKDVEAAWESVQKKWNLMIHGGAFQHVREALLASEFVKDMNYYHQITKLAKLKAKADSKRKEVERDQRLRAMEESIIKNVAFDDALKAIIKADEALAKAQEEAAQS